VQDPDHRVPAPQFVAGRLLGQWEARMDDIMTRHQRKYKLMPMLKALR
jgi:hypothetical protein